MGQKGAKLTEEATRNSEELVKKLSGLGDISSRKMFGGYGIFENGAMFALISSEGVVHFKTDDSNRIRYEKAGTDRHGKMPYYAVPDPVLQNDAELQTWAQESIAVAHAAKRKR